MVNMFITMSKGLFIWARLIGLARLTSKFIVKFSMCSYERTSWLGFLDLGFSKRDLGKRPGNFDIWTFQPSYRDESGFNSSLRLCHRAARMASSFFPCCIFHIISIPFNCSDTAIRVAKALIGSKVITLC